MPQEELSFTYFPENYRWSLGLLIGLNVAPWGGAESARSIASGAAEEPRRRQCLFGNGHAKPAPSRTAVANASPMDTGRRTMSAACECLYRGRALPGRRQRRPRCLYAWRGLLREAAKHISARAWARGNSYEGTSIPAIYVHAEPVGRRQGAAMVFFGGLV